MNRYYVAIDDTDNVADAGQGRGTGARARTLARHLIDITGGEHLGVTRHQLLVDPAIPYTSHNSSACIVIAADKSADEILPTLIDEGEAFLRQDASPGSDAGICVTDESRIDVHVIAWGRRAKAEVLEADEAHAIASRAGVHLAGLTGEKIGVIGALGAVGLRHSADDGRFLELGEMRQLVGEQPAERVLASGIDRFLAGDSEVTLSATELIDLGDKRVQPVLLDGRATLLLDPTSGPGAWRAAPREMVRRH